MADKAADSDRTPVIQFHSLPLYSSMPRQFQQDPVVMSSLVPSDPPSSQGAETRFRNDMAAGHALSSDPNHGSSSAELKKLSIQGEEATGQSKTRKRRRGVIEKRRRDRINSSLAELRRLVPTAFEKQGSQKLEKAEILQLAVQHLRHLSSRSPSQAWLYPAQNVSEYHSMGFRFCASEVDEFLSNEGVELHHPLRMRLSNHLQCFGAQRQNSYSLTATNLHQNQQPLPNLSNSSFANAVAFANVSCR